VRNISAKSRLTDRPSPTVTTKATLYTAPRQGLVYGRDRIPGRGLTPKEKQVLQGFPGAFSFNGNLTSQHRQVGNAVPPPLGEAVVSAMLAGLVGKRMKPAQVVRELRRVNRDALLFEPRDVLDKALVGVANTSRASPGELVAVYDHHKLLDLFYDGAKKNFPEYDEESWFDMASSHLFSNTYAFAEKAPHQPIIIGFEDLME
jgi:hypothetical protein